MAWLAVIDTITAVADVCMWLMVLVITSSFGTRYHGAAGRADSSLNSKILTLNLVLLFPELVKLLSSSAELLLSLLHCLALINYIAEFDVMTQIMVYLK